MIIAEYISLSNTHKYLSIWINRDSIRDCEFYTNDRHGAVKIRLCIYI